MRDEDESTGPRTDWVIRETATLGGMTSTPQIIDTARSAGATAAGVTAAEPFLEARAAIERSASIGLSGPLGFTYNNPELATDIRRSFPWACSIVVFGVSYADRSPAPPATGPIVGRFATSDHYETVRVVAEAVREDLAIAGAEAEVLIDDNRLVDRAAAVRAGVGWLGRSTMVLTPGAGPWMLLGSVVTDAALDSTDPMKRGCGTCTACIPACPTGALDDGTLDARRCLSTWLQTSGSIPLWIRPILGRRIYGCDDCLTSCPPGHPALRAADPGLTSFSFLDMLAREDEALLEDHGWWYVPRRDGKYIRRNLLVAAGNSEEESVRPALIDHLTHPSSMIRGHAAWSVARSMGPDASRPLEHALKGERAPEAREEMLLALLQAQRPETYKEVLSLDETVATDESLSALGLSGFDIGSNSLPPGEIVPVVVGNGTGQPDFVDMERVVRVNDRNRVLEGLRRRAGSAPAHTW